ncbi:hypothetical protein H310_04446 [Aphanomyces invadans]|uniref:tRNA/rRNA methyltransferase SpoU type domain-containing protein n=1 Tax=Aphanomyces invadans TaxID=157072 RepID=A0A024UCS5_9STRA|nr:hypothetical protein H310_04446 [Aphanomyces invadans]ETW04069.1 hypothetical protein H310_04446 [Aphanomyces invadans]|eukprot:XP_008867025.1 hypothetical protein H310_04446 [Aphanomyces invadans]
MESEALAAAAAFPLTPPRQYLIINNIQKRKNIRDMLLSAAAFGVVEVLVVGQKLLSFDQAMNIEDVLPNFQFPFRITRFATLGECRAHLVAVEPTVTILGIEILHNAKSVNDPDVFAGPTAVMAGNEGSGLSDAQLAICDRFVYIPQYGGGTASLNVTVATRLAIAPSSHLNVGLTRGRRRCPQASVQLSSAMPAPSSSTRHRWSFNFEVEQDFQPGPSWAFPGPGRSQNLHMPATEVAAIETELEKACPHALGEWTSTAITGNDVLSSCLYSSGIVASKAGKLAPVANILVAATMYLFRFIYIEVVSAIPLNGGSYNTMLNTTSKRWAAFVSALAIIAYLATGVVSAVSASDYLQKEVPGLDTIWSATGILTVFAILNVCGLNDSAVVALIIFAVHTLTLIGLVLASVVYAVQHPHIFWSNMGTPFPSLDVEGHDLPGNAATALFFGFSSAMLGVTGFETAANFVEEQAPGTFRKILRNIWYLSSFFNLTLSVLNLCVLPLHVTTANSNVVLAMMASTTVGRWFELWLSIDGFIVLSGSVLTSYVGITGLAKRLAKDRVLPEFFLVENAWRHTSHYIILAYFVVATSLVWILEGNVVMLSSVYSYAFLGLLVLFAVSAMLFKLKRSQMPRETTAPWSACIVGLFMSCMGFWGILMGDPKVSVVFATYLLTVSGLILLMLERLFVLRMIMVVLKTISPSPASDKMRLPLLQSPSEVLGGPAIVKAIKTINEPPIVFFCKHPDLQVLNKAVLYVRRNEHTDNLRIVHVYSRGGAPPAAFHDMVAVLDCMYPKLRIDSVVVEGEFSPSTVHWLSHALNIPTNMMFIRQPDNMDAHKVSMLGVRVITG